MDRVVFNDKTQICVLENGKARSYPSEYIARYIASSIQISNAKAWKMQGSGAKFREVTPEALEQEDVSAFINALCYLPAEDSVLYSFTVGDISGIYKKDLNAEKDNEAHVITSKDMEFLGMDYNERENLAAVGVKQDGVTEHIALLSLVDNDYKIITDGDTKDENPSFSRRDPDVLYYDSRGAGRDYAGNFVAYGNASLYRLNRATLDAEEILASPGVCYVKPKDDAEGNLYYIRKPLKEKKKRSNILLDILLIPVKILMAIYNFVETFVMMFTGKTFTSHDENPVKGRSKNSQQIFVDGNLIEIDKEYKRNERAKDKDPGVIPASWELVKRTPNGTETVLKKGVAHYEVLDGGSLIATNGKHLFRISPDGKCEKIADAGLCLRLASCGAPHPEAASPFGF